MLHIKQFHTIARAALIRDYPSLTDKQQTKIINRYISAVTTEINSKLRNFLLDNGRYIVSTTQINRKTKSTINGTQQYMHTWFMDNCPLIAVTKLGSNINKELTEIKMNYNLSIQIDLLYIDAVKDNLDTEEALNAMYNDDLIALITNGDNNLEFVPIDFKSLRAYIENTERTKHKYNVQVMDARIREAKRIYVIAKCMDGELPQIINESDFGRVYYKGPNLQSSHKDIRHAALGDCVEYDIENSVYAWRYTEAKNIAAIHNVSIKFPETLDYLDRKDYWRKELAEYTFQNTKITDEFKVQLIKTCFTSISFGAKGTANAVFWTDGSSQTTLSINDTIKNQVDRTRFLTHPFVVAFLKEQKDISDLIFTYHSAQTNFLGMECVKHKGKVSKNKVMSYLYQQQERKLLESAIQHFDSDNVLLKVHDAFYIKKNNPEAIMNARFDLKAYNTELDLKRTDWNDQWAILDTTVIDHKARMEQQEQLAKGYGNKYNANVEAQEPNIIDLYMQQGTEQHHPGYNRDDDPFYGDNES